MDSGFFTRDALFESSVEFTPTVDPMADGTRTGGASGTRMALTTTVIRRAVASTVLSCVLCVSPLDVALSDNLVRPDVLAEERRQLATWEMVFDSRVAELLRLRPGWEPGASAISDKAVAAVRETIEQVGTIWIPVPSVVPTVEGGVQVEWHENGVDLELRGTPDGEVFAYYAIGDEEREIFVKRPKQLRYLLRKLSSDPMHA